MSKRVTSAFHGSPDLHAWLLDQQAAGIVVCGITTNHCCETTVRVGANLGYDVLFPIDATFTFDQRHPDGTMLSAVEITRVTAASLHDEFANVTTTAEVLAGRARPIEPARAGTIDRFDIGYAQGQWGRPLITQAEEGGSVPSRPARTSGFRRGHC